MEEIRQQTRPDYGILDQSQQFGYSRSLQESNILLLRNVDQTHILATEESRDIDLKPSYPNRLCDTSNILADLTNQNGWHPLEEEAKDAVEENTSNLQLPNLSPPQDQTPGEAREDNLQQHVIIEQAAPQQVHTAIPLVTEVEARLFYRERIVLFSALAVSSLFLWLMLDQRVTFHVTFHGIIIPFYMYFTYVAVERGIIGYKKSRLDAWYKKENRLEFLSAVCCVLALIFLDLKLAGITSTSAIATIPLAISSIIYPLMSIELNSTKARKALYKVAYTTQVLLVTLKLDKTIDLEWVFVLMVAIAFFGLIGSLFFLYGCLIFILAYFVFRKNFQDRVLNRKVLFLGVFWHFLYYGLAVIADFIVIGIIAASARDGIGLLRTSALTSVGCNVFMTIFTLLTFRLLVKFVQFFDSDRILIESDLPPIQQRPIVSFEVEQKNTYFMSLSTTYFLPLTRTFLAKSKPNIQRIKSMFRDSRLGKSLNKQQTNNQDIQQSHPVNKQTLQKYKETLDGKLGNVLRDRSERPENTSSMHKFLQMFSPKVQKIEFKMTPRDDLAKNNKLCLSLGNIDDLEDVYSKPKPDSHREDEKLCYLCYSNPPNSVLMNCGHGGFCYECATAAIKVKNECMECRAKVEAIHKIDLESKQPGIIKATETMKVTLKDPNPA